MSKPTILLVNRRSIAVGNRRSMSVRVRLGSPLYYLQNQHLIALIERDEQEITKAMMESCDMVAMSRSYSEQAIEIMAMASSLAKPILYDVDDDLFALPKWTSIESQSVKFANHQRQLELASIITVPHQLLVDRITTASAPIRLIPTGVDLKMFDVEMVPVREVLVFSNLMEIKLENSRKDFVAALHDFMQKTPTLHLDIFSDGVSEICEIPNANYRGFLDFDSYRKQLSQGGYLFAISPLGGEEDAEAMRHNECKSAVKYLDYAAAKIPCIFSDCVVYRRAVHHGVNGLLVKNTYEGWYQALNEMYRNAELRKELACNAYEDIKNNFQIEKISKEWFKVINDLLVGNEGKNLRS